MEYQVPQFIEVESKIVGPLTLRQFIYLAGTVGLCVILFFSLPIIFAILLSIPIVAFGAALAFYKINGKPFIEVLEAGVTYYAGSKLLLWKRNRDMGTERKSAVVKETKPSSTHDTAKLTRGKLSELAWSLDIQNPDPEI